MARATLHTKSKRGAEYRCVKCTDRINPGEKYYEWSFRYGGTRRQHASHGAPRPSQLTQSKMATVYEAIEAAEDCQEDLGSFADAIEQIVEVANEVASEYRDAAEQFGGAGENAERADELESWVEGLEDKASTIREALDALTEAQEAISSCPL